MGCIFCNIAAGEIQAMIVHEDDRIVAFRDINPAAPTHILIIPREHVARAADLEPRHEGLAGHMIVTAGKIAAREGLSDFRLVFNSGSGAGQSVFHLHLHLLGGRPLAWPPG
jgi:histidine triad (HIT) family protein